LSAEKIDKASNGDFNCRRFDGSIFEPPILSHYTIQLIGKTLASSCLRWQARLLLCLAVYAVQAPLYAQEAAIWPDTFLNRVQLVALIQTLNADLLASRSATFTLERWCRDHGLAEIPKISAQLVKGTAKEATVEQRRRLQVSDQDTIKYRRVDLRCGNRVLSEAENWYVPSRLSAEINRLLDSTDTPFGKAIESLEPYRQTIAVKQFWTPLPEGWERENVKLPATTNGTLVFPDALFEHRAIVYRRDHKPISEVTERYQRQLLAFPPRTSR